MVEVVYVITWRYGDGSGSGTVAAFTTEAAAEKMLGILNQQDSMRNYKIEPVPFDSAAGVAPSQAPEQPLPYWEPCNPGCDPEFNGQRDRHCAKLCKNARDALGVMVVHEAQPDDYEEQMAERASIALEQGEKR